MLKKRVIPVLLMKDGKMVKGKKFRNFRETGSPESTVDVYSSQEADELIFLNISDNKNYFEYFKKIVLRAAKKCLMPLTIGGNIKNIENVREMLNIGADKIIITSQILDDLELINKVSEEFGSQCMIVGIDYSYDEIEKKHFVWKNLFSEKTKFELLEYIKILKKYNFGQIFLNSIDKDGLMKGYDLEVIKKVKKSANKPIIACGGAGNFEHVEKLFLETGVEAASCASIFHFGDNNPIRLRTYLKNKNIAMRVLK